MYVHIFCIYKYPTYTSVHVVQNLLKEIKRFLSLEEKWLFYSFMPIATSLFIYLFIVYLYIFLHWQFILFVYLI